MFNVSKRFLAEFGVVINRLNSRGAPTPLLKFECFFGTSLIRDLRDDCVSYVLDGACFVGTNIDISGGNHGNIFLYNFFCFCFLSTLSFFANNNSISSADTASIGLYSGA